MIIPRCRNTPDIVPYLTQCKQLEDKNTGDIQTFGYMNGVRVSVQERRIKITGSLSRVVYPNNIYPLDLQSTKEAIEALSDGIHLNVAGAVVTGLEYGTQYVMEHPINEYLPLLGDMPKLQRLAMTPSSLYYMGKGARKNKVFVFYDKIADAKSKGLKIPPYLERCNLLKFEMRLTAHLAQQLQMDEIKADTLWNNTFYRLLMDKYQKAYFSISVNRQKQRYVMDKIQTVSDAYNVFIARLMQNCTEAEISAFMNDLKNAKVFNDRKYYTRLKTRLQSLNKWKEQTRDSKLVRELDDAIINVGAYV